MLYIYYYYYYLLLFNYYYYYSVLNTTETIQTPIIAEMFISFVTRQNNKKKYV